MDVVWDKDGSLASLPLPGDPRVYALCRLVHHEQNCRWVYRLPWAAHIVQELPEIVCALSQFGRLSRLLPPTGDDRFNCVDQLRDLCHDLLLGHLATTPLLFCSYHRVRYCTRNPCRYEPRTALEGGSRPRLSQNIEPLHTYNRQIPMSARLRPIWVDLTWSSGVLRYCLSGRLHAGLPSLVRASSPTSQTWAPTTDRTAECDGYVQRRRAC